MITASLATCTSNFRESSKAVSAGSRVGRPSITTPIRMASRSKKPLPLREAGRRSSVGRKTGDTPYKVITVNSWEEYLSIISDSPYQNWAFRGQRDASAPLFSALSRHFMAFRVDQRAWPEQEERVLRIFKRKAIHFLDVVPDRDDDFEWLALMQDHGAPTRLLDFTWSPYVAAFFALHNTTKEGVIWACNPVEIDKMKPVDRDKPGSFRKYVLSGQGHFVGLGEPYAMNRRLIVQSGTFLVPAMLNESIE